MKDNETQSAINELVESVAEQLDAGVPTQEIINSLSDAGLGRFEAEQLVNRIDGLRYEARKRAGTKDFGWGFLFLLGGAAITFLTWATAEPGGSFWAMWGAMALGGFYILRGLYRKITSATNAGTRLRWILGGIILIGGIGGSGVAITNMMTPSELTSPSDSFVVYEDSTDWTGYSTIRVSGTVTNTHSEWSIKGVKVELEATDEEDNLIKTFDVPVVPSKILPGEKGIYNQTLQMPSSCEYVQPSVLWEWVAP